MGVLVRWRRLLGWAKGHPWRATISAVVAFLAGIVTLWSLFINTAPRLALMSVGTSG